MARGTLALAMQVEWGDALPDGGGRIPGADVGWWAGIVCQFGRTDAKRRSNGILAVAGVGRCCQSGSMRETVWPETSGFLASQGLFSCPSLSRAQGADGWRAQ